MTSTIEYVNPEMARTILAEQALIAEVNGRPTNRKVQKQRVANYARQMREGA